MAKKLSQMTNEELLHEFEKRFADMIKKGTAVSSNRFDSVEKELAKRLGIENFESEL